MSEAKSSKKIDWNDPSVIRYHTLKLKPKTVAQARKNMINYLKNQGNYRIKDFKGMSYNEIRPIFEKVWDFNQHIEPMDSEHIAKFDKSAKDLNEMLENQIIDKSKKGLGYNDVSPPHPLILNRPTNIDLSYSGLDEFKELEVNMYGPSENMPKPTNNCDKESHNSEVNTYDSLKQQQVSDSESSSTESPLKVDKETVMDWKEKFFHPAGKVETVKPKHSETPVKRTVRYAEMYRSQRPRGNQRN
ncbi:hypothetical protein Tco_0910073 [Tanacetum coccineum]|uniref:Uncharacterized protein n=1 Tax=Tanacetum coccineum TaxID=301880 RepID=A0ABQ5CS91_9ASTR